MGEDLCSGGNSIEDDSELLKLGKDLRKKHKELAQDLDDNYIGDHI